MQKLHIANTYFEFELEGSCPSTLKESMEHYAVCRKLQYLPLSYADSSDGVLVTKIISQKAAAKMVTYEEVNSEDWDEVISWGASKQVADWAKEQGIPYSMPPFEVVKEINSRKFLFEYGIQVPRSTLLTSQEELSLWLEKNECPFVLKRMFGVAGRGMRVCREKNSIGHFCSEEWKRGRPILAEPWKKRELDFSSQWKIDASGAIKYEWVVRFEVSQHGAYTKTFVKDAKLKEFDVYVQMHLKIAKELIQKIASMGYFGHVGLDAFLYWEGERLLLHPVCEVNGRETLSSLVHREK